MYEFSNNKNKLPKKTASNNSKDWKQCRLIQRTQIKKKLEIKPR